MWLLYRIFGAKIRYVVWTLAAAVAAAVYTVLSTRDQITLFDGAPHIVEWWEPYVWPGVAFIVTQRLGAWMVRRTLRQVQDGLNRLKGDS